MSNPLDFCKFGRTVLKTEKNYVWYKSLVGKLLNEVQLEKVLFSSWIDVERIEFRVRGNQND